VQYKVEKVTVMEADFRLLSLKKVKGIGLEFRSESNDVR